MPKRLKSFIKSFDYFGVNFEFTYKARKTYKTVGGGVCFITYLIVVIFYVISNAIPLLKRKNMSIISYSFQTPQTNIINFLNHSSSFALGVDCDVKKSLFKDPLDIYRMFEFQVKYVQRTQKDGIETKHKVNLSVSLCKHSDFYNEFNSTFDNFGYEHHYCVKDLNYSLQGIYSDDIFKYFEISMVPVNDSKELYDTIRELLKFECKFDIFFIDSVIDIYDYKHPIKRFINNKFVSIKPDEYNKMDLFFEEKNFDSFENYLFDNSYTHHFIGYSYSEIYSIYKGEDRYEKKPYEYDKFAKLFLRASLSRTKVERKYMKITEFTANMTSILSQVLLAMFVIISAINRFYANVSLIKNIFLFKDAKNIKGQKIKKDFVDFLKENKKSIHSKMAEYEKENMEKLQKTTLNPLNMKSSIFNSIGGKDNSRIMIGKDKFDNDNSMQNLKYFKGVQPSSLINLSKKNIKETNENRGNCSFNFNVKKIIIAITCHKCLKGVYKKKAGLYFNTRPLLFFQLDILTYLKKLQLLDLMCYALFEQNENKILQFLAKPSVSFVNKTKAVENMISSNNVNKNDLEVFYNAFLTVFLKNNKSQMQNKLCEMAREEMIGIMNEVEINN